MTELQMVSIRSRYDAKWVLFECEAESLGEAVKKALVADANLARTDLAGANLAGANLAGANLARTNLAGANLARTYLARTNLADAYLAGADLADANLARANLARTDLAGANLADANLARAYLEPIRTDLFAVLDAAPAEVPALLEAVKAGRIDGSAYSGDCACLVGTLANARGCEYNRLEGLEPDGDRPAERWFLALKPGDKPETNAVASLTAQWIEQWLAQVQTPEVSP